LSIINTYYPIEDEIKDNSLKKISNKNSLDQKFEAQKFNEYIRLDTKKEYVELNCYGQEVKNKKLS